MSNLNATMSPKNAVSDGPFYSVSLSHVKTTCQGMQKEWKQLLDGILNAGESCAALYEYAIAFANIRNERQIHADPDAMQVHPSVLLIFVFTNSKHFAFENNLS